MNRNFKKIITITLPLLCLFFGLWLLIEPYCLKIVRYPLTDSDIPAGFHGKTIVFLTDIHRGIFFSQKRLSRLVNKVNDLSCDMVLLGGDYVQHDEKYIPPVFNELGKLQAPLGIFGVLGNHDHWENASLSRSAMRQNGIIPLDNRYIPVHSGRDTIYIAGVGDIYEDRQDISTLLSDTSDDDFVILLSHNPDYAEKLSTDRIDYMLAGHTHGGQITFFGLFAPLLPSQYGQKYRSGKIITDHTTVIVSPGIGTITPPLRFFARPQIVILEL